MRVLLANDSSQYSQVAADYLRSLPFRKPIDLDIVSAVVPPMMIDAGGVMMPSDLGLFLEEERKATAARLEETASQWAGPVHSLSTHIPIGAPSTELLDLAESTAADLIVLGAIGHSGFERVLLGSISDYVATHSEVSTLIVRPASESSSPTEPRKIMLALSGGPEDRDKIEWLKHFDWPARTEVHLVRILALNTFYRQDIRLKASSYWNELLTQSHRQMEEIQAQVEQLGVTTETHLVEAVHVGQALVDYVETHSCDLVIAGDSHSGLLARMLLGSTSRYVLRHAQCSVLILRDNLDRDDAPQPTAAATS
ncbi:MAG: universal stress protein [Novipirellula sp. JB048]